MVFPNKLAYIRYEFTWNAGQDIQEFGIFVQKRESGDWPNPGSAAAAQAIADKAVPAFASNMNAGFYAQAVSAVQVSAYTMKDDGRKVDQKGVALFDGGDAFTGGGTGAMPAENSVVLSLYGYDPTKFGGPTRAQQRGRMYLPTPASGNLGSDGLVTTAVVNTQLGNWQGWFDDITGAITLAGGTFHVDPVIRSLGGKNGAEMATQVGWLRMGRLVDTQRRRRNKLDEGYINHELT